MQNEKGKAASGNDGIASLGASYAPTDCSVYVACSLSGGECYHCFRYDENCRYKIRDAKRHLMEFGKQNPKLTVPRLGADTVGRVVGTPNQKGKT